jgi:hypothetical protein
MRPCAAEISAIVGTKVILPGIITGENNKKEAAPGDSFFVC